MNNNINWYSSILYLLKNNDLITNWENGDNIVECWFVVKNKKYMFRSIKINIGIDYWLNGIYVKKSEDLLLIEDNKLKKLYDTIENVVKI